MSNTSDLKVSMAEARNAGAQSLCDEATASKFTTLCDLFSSLEASLVCELIIGCLFLSDVIHFDTAMCFKTTRTCFIDALRIYMSKVLKINPTIVQAQIDWLIARNIALERVKIIQAQKVSLSC